MSVLSGLSCLVLASVWFVLCRYCLVCLVLCQLVSGLSYVGIVWFVLSYVGIAMLYMVLICLVLRGSL